ncbi:RDD family protein [Pseudanabaena mucicola]|uniref:RDD family protein n=1 Tax=Pseudanabaena mucicola FACHB-723 TaxID=2692860 RepID=A0ABR7ZU41_9CYAN|nr:RDD family protein [Pseudanabaena mucicola]MBD2187312.1 RDD family protein [Pseudanabaena mucicola FACHB-723]
MDFEPAYSRYPLATVNQRLGALIIDFLSCWFISELVLSLLSISSSNPLRLFTFVVTWFVFRVFISTSSQGQSFGRWLMSIRVIDAEYGKTAGLAAFFKREIFVFACSIFLIETITTTFIVFAWIPFAADAAFAIVDEEKRQAFHDRISRTISIQSRKGFAIDQKLGKLFNQAGQQATKLYQERQERGIYDDEYSAPRTKPKRRPRTKSRPPQDFDFPSDREYDRADPYAEPLDPPRDVYKGDADNFDDWDKDDFRDNDYDEQPVKRSARRPRRR